METSSDIIELTESDNEEGKKSKCNNSIANSNLKSESDFIYKFWNIRYCDVESSRRYMYTLNNKSNASKNIIDVKELNLSGKLFRLGGYSNQDLDRMVLDIETGLDIKMKGKNN